MVVQSRRKFLQLGSLGVAAAGAALTPALAPGTAVAQQPAPAEQPVPAGSLPDGSFMAYVKDHRTGDVVVMVGEHEVVYRDADLARRLAHIAGRAKTA